MPGFFLTFVLLCFAGGWARYLSNRIGRRWPLILPAVGFATWCSMLLAVSAAVTVGGSDEGGGMTLARMFQAATYARYLAFAVLVGMLPVTAIAWSRPAPEPDRAG